MRGADGRRWVLTRCHPRYVCNGKITIHACGKPKRVTPGLTSYVLLRLERRTVGCRPDRSNTYSESSSRWPTASASCSTFYRAREPDAPTAHRRPTPPSPLHAPLVLHATRSLYFRPEVQNPACNSRACSRDHVDPNNPMHPRTDPCWCCGIPAHHLASIVGG